MLGHDPTKTRLLEAAGEEFAEKGFDGATIRSISQRAGANLAAVNYHFGDKEQLYIRAVVEAHRCGSSEMLPDDQFFQGEPADQLRLFIRFFLMHVLAIHDHELDWQRMLMLREMMRPTAASQTLVEEVIRPRFQRLQKILRSICPDAEEKRLHLIGFSVVGQCIFYRMARPIAERVVGAEKFERFDLEMLTEHIAGFTLAALGLTSPLDAAGEPVTSEPEHVSGGEAHP
jgi:TetR/AcrR family transcriptional regulator, regulator of cefoperazone and chloramphenicol sensitivity